MGEDRQMLVDDVPGLIQLDGIGDPKLHGQAIRPGLRLEPAETHLGPA